MKAQSLLLLGVQMVLASVAAAQSIDTSKWYAIYNNNNQYIDSSSGDLTLTTESGGLSIVSLSSDKGQRFGFPEGIKGEDSPTPIRCQAHSNHWVAINSDGDPALTTNGGSNTDIFAIIQNNSESGTMQIAFRTTNQHVDGNLQLQGLDYTWWNIAEVQSA